MIKTQLKGVKELWLDKLQSVLWAYQMMIRTPIGKTAFCLAFGSEADIPTKIGLTNYRVAHHDEKRNEGRIVDTAFCTIYDSSPCSLMMLKL